MCKSEKKIIKTIEISPRHLGFNLLEEIKKKMDDKFLNTSDKDENIIILKINKVQILSNNISKDSLHVYFTISFQAECFQPHVNCNVCSPIYSISEEGILSRHPNLNVDYFIPSDYLEEVGFRYDSFHSIWKKDNVELRNGDECNMIIEELRYTNNKFNCICKINLIQL